VLSHHQKNRRKNNLTQSCTKNIEYFKNPRWLVIDSGSAKYETPTRCVYSHSAEACTYKSMSMAAVAIAWTCCMLYGMLHLHHGQLASHQNVAINMSESET
jgi:hypothetical protein